MLKIVSGGQTGADRAALDWAMEHGFTSGGWCPKGRMAEDGPILDHYVLQETPCPDYPIRTEWNVRDSDATVIFSIASRLSGGSLLTRQLAQRLGKPCLHLAQESQRKTAARRLRDFVAKHQVQILNVAGPRLSSEPAIGAFVWTTLQEAFSQDHPQ